MMAKSTNDKVTYVHQIINEDGEIVEKETTYRRSAEPPFIKLYIDCLCNFKGLSTSLNPILLEFLKYMTYANIDAPHGGQIIYMNKAMKEEVAKKVGKTLKRVEQALTDFVKSGIFIRIATGTYQVNADLFGKGDWKDIKNIRATFNFADGTVTAEIEKEDVNDEVSA